ncbi:hypothetical protein KDA23_03310, partial [Candidatus Saccharibacteria bacterium]|nr:hypothetical protein [Candidatus Saccharibacteria bacterium]
THHMRVYGTSHLLQIPLLLGILIPHAPQEANGSLMMSYLQLSQSRVPEIAHPEQRWGATNDRTASIIVIFTF